jgi:hypothetical protein
MRRFAKPLYGLTPVPRVRIPPSPPVLQFLPFAIPDYQLTTKFKASASAKSAPLMSGDDVQRLARRQQLQLGRGDCLC